MTSSAGRVAALLAPLLLLPACAGSGGAAAPSPSPAPTQEGPGAAEAGPVLEVEHTGGFVTPQLLAGRLPLAAVYADGRVITEGPVPAIYPGPALPNVQVHRIEPGQVQQLVDRALAAGVGASPDLGTPPVADAPSTRFTVSTGAGVQQLEVYALGMGDAPGDLPGDLPGGGTDGGPTPEQQAARAELSALLEEITTSGAAGTEPYRPEAVAAVATDWTDPGDGLASGEVAWPGPPLPGEALDERLGVWCTTARAEAARAVLDAAATATSTTPWTGADGHRWSLLLRPLLPHESGCADLGG